MTTESMLSSIKSSLGAAMRGRIFTCSFASGSMIPLACQYLSLLECIFFNAFSLILATSLSDIFSASSWLRRYSSLTSRKAACINLIILSVSESKNLPGSLVD